MLVEVDKAAGRPDQNIDAVAQGFGLILVTGASVNQAHAQGCVFAELGGVSMNLYRQFPCWCQHDGTDTFCSVFGMW